MKIIKNFLGSVELVPTSSFRFGLGAGGIILGSAALNGISNAIQSGTQKDIASDTNVTNMHMLDNQMQYQTSEREAAQEWNEPLAQRQRYEKAGINPYLALGNINSGTTQAQTSPSANPAVGYDYKNPLSGVMDSVIQAIDTLGLDEKYKGIQLDNQAKAFANQMQSTQMYWNLVEQRERILNTKENTAEKRTQIKALDTQIEQLRQQIDFFDSTLPEQKRKIKLENDKTEYENKQQQLLNDAFPALNELQCSKLRAEINSEIARRGLLDSQSKLTDEQTKKAVEEVTYQKIANMIASNEELASAFDLDEKRLNSERVETILRTRQSKIGNFIDYLLSSPKYYFQFFK